MLGVNSVPVEKVGPLKDSMGNLITKNKDAAYLLNNYFSSVFTLENIQIIPEPIRIFKGDFVTEGLYLTHITPELVEKKLEKLNVNKCPGLDGIHPRMLFELRKQLAIDTLINFLYFFFRIWSGSC